MKETNESYLIISGNCKSVTKEDIFDKHTLKLHAIWKIYTKDVVKKSPVSHNIIFSKR